MTRDPEAKRKQLLDAGFAEFAEHGIAGARIDRVAERAGCSAGLVYTYFDSKDGLFDAVFDELVADTLASTPITVDNLPEYAGRLFDRYEARPEIARLATWQRLERAGTSERIPAVTKANKGKVAALRKAQQDGTVSDRFDAEHLLVLLLSISAMWTSMTPEMVDIAHASRARRRASVVDAVRCLLE